MKAENVEMIAESFPGPVIATSELEKLSFRNEEKDLYTAFQNPSDFKMMRQYIEAKAIEDWIPLLPFIQQYSLGSDVKFLNRKLKELYEKAIIRGEKFWENFSKLIAPDFVHFGDRLFPLKELKKMNPDEVKANENVIQTMTYLLDTYNTTYGDEAWSYVDSQTEQHAQFFGGMRGYIDFIQNLINKPDESEVQSNDLGEFEDSNSICALPPSEAQKLESMAPNRVILSETANQKSLIPRNSFSKKISRRKLYTFLQKASPIFILYLNI
jgi:hypothetical protein